MATYADVSRALASLTSPHKPGLKQRYPSPYPSLSPQRRLDEDEAISPRSKSIPVEEDSLRRDSLDDLDGETLLGTTSPTRKRLSTPLKEKKSSKRRKADDGYRPGDNENDSDDEGDTLVAPTSAQTPQKRSTVDPDQDGRAMPPPPRPSARPSGKACVLGREIANSKVRDGDVSFQPLRQDSLVDEDEIFNQKTACRRQDRSEVNPEFEYDRAFRHAQAQELPEDSGTWSDVEKDLFYRLAMRGFEPLLPGHWNMDFKTLPQFLLAAHGQEALITPSDKREFRAKHYLRNLFGIASKVRDRSLVGLRTEPCIERPLKEYISWALSDAGVDADQRPKAMPVHVMVSKRPGETAHKVLQRMSRKLYGLARRYQDIYRVRQSVEAHASSDRGAKFPSTASSPQYDDAYMPTLIGFMIVSSVVAVVTVHSQSTPPESVIIHQNRASQDPIQSIAAPTSRRHPSALESPTSTSTREESGLRVIANFDFSTHDGYDVWDGLAMAICVMRIRKTMLELAALADQEGQTGPGGLWEKLRPVRKSLSSEP